MIFLKYEEKIKQRKVLLIILDIVLGVCAIFIKKLFTELFISFNAFKLVPRAELLTNRARLKP